MADRSGLPEGAALAEIEHAAVEIAHAAGARALAHFRSTLPLEFKGDRQDDPVTAADREIEAFLRTALRARFPDHGLLGEEGADDIATGAAYVWTLDPLDGTANFAAGLPLWGVSLGLLHHGRPAVGCIWVPVGPTLERGVYHARAGGGAFFEGHPVHVEAGDDERGRLVALPGRSWTRFRFVRPRRGAPRPRRAGADPRTLGSITAEMVLVAAGSLRLAIFVQPKVWDVAAGALIVQEAGGLALVWRSQRWRRLEAYAPMHPPKTSGSQKSAALRHWSEPVLVGTPSTAALAAARLRWHPRLPKALQKALGLG